MSIRKCGRRMGKPTTYSSSEPTKAKWFAPLIPSRTIPSAKSDRSSSKKSKSLKRRRPSPTCGSFRRRTRWDLVSLSFPTTKFRRFLFTAASYSDSILTCRWVFFFLLQSFSVFSSLSYRSVISPYEGPCPDGLSFFVGLQWMRGSARPLLCMERRHVPLRHRGIGRPYRPILAHSKHFYGLLRSMSG